MFAFSGLILTNYWILSFCHFDFVFGEKPRCVGNPLSQAEFSKEEDVGFLRDVCVDVVVRNIYNKLKYEASTQCEELANMRTSTCFPKCLKWKRSSFWNKGATNRVMAKAVELMKHLNEVVSVDASFETLDDEKFVTGCINDAIRRLLRSGVIDGDSELTVKLKNLRTSFCFKYQLNQYQEDYQRREGHTEVLKELRDLFENKDLITAAKRFIQNYEREHRSSVANYQLVDLKNKVGDDTLAGIYRLSFQIGRGTKARLESVILKIPSLAAVSYERLKEIDVYAREAYLYEKVLPKLYELGRCGPFAPRLYTVTDSAALVLEDLSADQYKTVDKETQFDGEHAQVSVEALASYHAFSYKYLRTLADRDNDPSISLIRSFRPVLSRREESDLFRRFLEIVEPSLSRPIYVKMVKLKSEILSDHIARKNPYENPMTVITHGDFRPNNILFKRIAFAFELNAKIIGWHSSREACPVFDLIFFLVTSVPAQTVKDTSGLILRIYRDMLNIELRRLGCNREYSEEELARDMAYYRYHYVRTLCIFWQHAMLDEPPSVQIETYRSKTIDWLNYLDEAGII